MSNVAYGKRKVLAIRLRKLVHGLFVVWRAVNRRLFSVPGTGERPVRKIVVIVHTSDPSELGDLLNRLSWGFPSRPDLSIRVLVPAALADIGIEELQQPAHQARYLGSTAHFTLDSRWGFRDLMQADRVLLTRFPRPLAALLPVIVAKVEVPDKTYYAHTEGNVWMKQYYYTLSEGERREVEALSRHNFSRLVDSSRDKADAYCFLTGPSFDRYRDFTYGPQSTKIVCNSIVKDNDFLEYIGGPDILTFADCVFHFGPSRYAARFREAAVEVVERYGCYVVVPEVTVPLLLRCFPQLQERIIGLGKSPEFNFPTSDDLTVKGTKSVLTYFMLPLASSLAQRVFFLGADGRKPDERYFWKHNPKVQYDDLMESVFSTHPSFFRDRIYSSDYAEYCDVFERIVRYGEERGREYRSLTPSHIPALSARSVGGEASA